MNQAFLDYYRCPDSFANFVHATGDPDKKGPDYFTFGPGLTCYGNSEHLGSGKVADPLPDLLERVRIEDSTCVLPFDPTEIADNLRLERYVERENRRSKKTLIHSIYYALRPALPVFLRRRLQRAWLKGWDQKPFPRWPVDKSVDQLFERLMLLALQSGVHQRIPFIWFWPQGKSSCAIMTHDVETATGLRWTPQLMDINDSFQIKSSFQIIPAARYVADRKTLLTIKERGFEVNVHDLKHDGHLFDSHETFLDSASQINNFAIRFGSRGFRAGALYRNQEWFDAFRFSYDMSVPNVGHLDPQPGGCCTVMPYFVGDILELPVTTIQDYSLFNILGTHSLDLWNTQIDQIMQQHGLISFIVHPDYLDKPKARAAYIELLRKLAMLGAEAELWIALPGEVDEWWRQRSQMTLVPDKDGWRIEGHGSERARIAYATLASDRMTYIFP
ncbi:MAG TPA: hypothetical protein VFE22_15745 [Edaphobacter sp.]|nr:hypothetical protein [Edaphobacter sp.]